LNYLELGKGNAVLPNPNKRGSVSDNDPEIDFRDDQTVWVWLADDLCVEMDRELVKRLHDGFKEQ